MYARPNPSLAKPQQGLWAAGAKNFPMRGSVLRNRMTSKKEIRQRRHFTSLSVRREKPPQSSGKHKSYQFLAELLQRVRENTGKSQSGRHTTGPYEMGIVLLIIIICLHVNLWFRFFVSSFTFQADSSNFL